MRLRALFSFVLILTAGMLIACGHWPVSAGQAHGADLRSIIDDQIRGHVRESYGELGGQNFSDADYERFTREKVPDQVVAQLKTNSRFLAAVETVRAMSPADRDAYLKKCRLPMRKTWAQLGEISPKGTTEAGQRAEIDLANAIADLAEKTLAGSPGKAAK